MGDSTDPAPPPPFPADRQLGCVWLSFRQVFWALSLIVVGGWTPAAFYLLYWLPHPIQFGNFLLLPLFYLQVMYRNQRSCRASPPLRFATIHIRVNECTLVFSSYQP